MQKNPKKRLGCDGMPAKGNADVRVSFKNFCGIKNLYVSIYN